MTKLCLFLSVCLAYILSSVAADCNTAAVGLLNCEEALATTAAENMRTEMKAVRTCFEENDCKHEEHWSRHPHEEDHEEDEDEDEEERREREHREREEREHHEEEEDEDEDEDEDDEDEETDQKEKERKHREKERKREERRKEKERRREEEERRRKEKEHRRKEQEEKERKRREKLAKETPAEKALRNQTFHCHEAVFQLEQANVTACVKADTGVTIRGEHHRGRQEKKGKEGKRGRGRKHSCGRKPDFKKIMEKFHAKIRKACHNSSTPDAVNNTIKCLNATRVAGFGNLKTFCSGRNSCSEGYAGNAGCNRSEIIKAKIEVEKAHQKCVEAQKKISFESLAATEPICAGLNFKKEAPKHHGPEHPKAKKGKEHENKEEKKGKEDERKGEEEERKGEEEERKGEEEERKHKEEEEKHKKEEKVCSIFTGKKFEFGCCEGR